MDRIKTQANKLWQLISNPATAATYQQTLGTTWAMLKETGLLLWLVVCLVFVLGDWFWHASYVTGQKTRIWIDNLQASTEEPTPETSGSDLLNKTGQSLLSVGQTSFAAALAAAKAQLGIESTPAAQPIGLIPSSPEQTAPAPIVPTASATPETPANDASEG
jgi:hypothetical protein